MTHRIILILAFFFIYAVPKACDICGAGAGSYYLGILPDFNKRFAGMRYQQKSLLTHLSATGDRTHKTVDEHFLTAEFWGAWNIGKRFRVMGIVPYNLNQREIKDLKQKNNQYGLGDVTLIGYYQLLDSKKSTGDKLLAHSLWLGGGIHLATGKYNNTARSMASINDFNSFQSGSGSTDFSLQLAYDIRCQDIGLNTTVSYKLNTTNKYEYRYGNKFSANMVGYYKININNKITISPNAGALYENSDKDVEFHRFESALSGGYMLNGIAGVETNFKRFSVGGNFQRPLSQDIAGGRAKAGSRFMAHISYSF